MFESTDGLVANDFLSIVGLFDALLLEMTAGGPGEADVEVWFSLPLQLFSVQDNKYETEGLLVEVFGGREFRFFLRTSSGGVLTRFRPAPLRSMAS
jgi:hypothetical protein